MEKVVLGLSGGVDSAVAASLLQRQGYEVHCLWLDIGLGGGEDAEELAARLGLPFARGDIREALEREVCAPFAADYLAGRTPLPCARCNPSVKFPALLAEAERIGAGYVATGHYARVVDGVLYRGKPANDQAFMLSRLPKKILQRVIFPLGDYEKTQTRALAEEMGLPVAHKPDSMEICFIPDQDYAAWLERRGTVPPPGDFVDRNGKVLGRHKGIHHYTLGQRRGLGIPAEHRLFVSAIRPEENQVVLSDGADLYVDFARGEAPNWIAIDALTGPRSVEVRLRHSKTALPAVISPNPSGGVDIALQTPGRAPTPGQLAAFYQGDMVVGSAWIC